MSVSGIGDLATNVLFRSQNTRLQKEMEKTVQELASGQVSVRDTALGGSYRAISGIERSLTRLDAYDLAATEAEGMADAVQFALEDVQQKTGDLSIELMSAGGSGSSESTKAVAKGAAQDFETVIARLNTNYAGRTVFGGVSTDIPAIAEAADIMAALETAISGETNAAGVASAIEAWFAPGGEFDTGGYYTGSSQALAPMNVGADRKVSLEITAADDEFRDTLAGMAMAALIDTGPLEGAPEEQLELASYSGEVLLNANQDLLLMRAGVGAVQESIEDARTEATAERNMMDLALNELLSIDPFDRATKLEQVESQITMLYTLTVRSSGLRLTNFM